MRHLAEVVNSALFLLLYAFFILCGKEFLPDIMIS